MRGRSFNSLLSGKRLGTMLQWSKAHRCPCASAEGEADRECGVCAGRGRYYDEWSDAFRAGFLGQTSNTLMQMLKQAGGTVDVGDAVLVLGSDCPCYDSISTNDRIQVVQSTDTIEWTLAAGGQGVKLPVHTEILGITYRSNDGKEVKDGILSVEQPATAGDPTGVDTGILTLPKGADWGLGGTPLSVGTIKLSGKIVVTRPAVLRFRACRLYEVARELPQVRGFEDGFQPKKVQLKRIDWTVR